MVRINISHTHSKTYFIGDLKASLLIADIVQAIGAVLSLKWIKSGKVEVGPFCTSQGVIKIFGASGVALSTMASPFFWGGGVGVSCLLKNITGNSYRHLSRSMGKEKHQIDENRPWYRRDDLVFHRRYPHHGHDAEPSPKFQLHGSGSRKFALFKKISFSIDSYESASTGVGLTDTKSDSDGRPQSNICG